MGHARWTSDSYATYATTTNYRTASRAEVFSNNYMPVGLDPSKITLRESCDSENNPSSRPIILALDVTGSMGEYAEKIAKDCLPELIGAIIEQSPVRDPHIMFMGVGDVRSDTCPLQVSQFEADIKILETLRTIYLEGRGGGNSTESYDLPWYFAAHKTAIDCFDKRQEKGFLFTFGDEEAPNEPLADAHLAKVFGGQNWPSAGTTSELLSKAKEKYQVFHVVIEQGSHCHSHKLQVRGSWTELMGPNVLFLKDANNLTELVVATIKIAEGADMDEVINASKNPDALRYAFSNSYSGQ